MKALIKLGLGLSLAIERVSGKSASDTCNEQSNA